jgi:hypothetical protein
MQPIKWDNRECLIEQLTKSPIAETHNIVYKKCTPYSCETPVSTHGEIIALLHSGWPICPECGADMIPVEEK